MSVTVTVITATAIVIIVTIATIVAIVTATIVTIAPIIMRVIVTDAVASGAMASAIAAGKRTKIIRTRIKGASSDAPFSFWP